MRTVNNCTTLIALLATIFVIGQTPEQENMMKAMQSQVGGDMSLSTAVPLSDDQLKTLLPKSLAGMELIEVKHGAMSAANMASIDGVYDTKGEPEFISTDSGGEKLNPNRRRCNIGVADGAGPTGSNMLMSMKMMSGMAFESEDENKQQKTLEVQGIKAQQVYHKKSNKTELQFVYLDRFMVSVSATNRNPEETWQLIEHLDLARLSELVKDN
ncbi:MAG: hypothetical protein ACR2MM_08725 [Flavobacteriaceae bacterium]